MKGEKKQAASTADWGRGLRAGDTRYRRSPLIDPSALPFSPLQLAAGVVRTGGCSYRPASGRAREVDAPAGPPPWLV